MFLQLGAAEDWPQSLLLASWDPALFNNTYLALCTDDRPMYR